MRIIVCKNYDELSEKAANMIASQLTLKPDSVLGLATGSTPLGTYANLIKMYNEGEIDFSAVKTFNLDEYYPIKKDNSQSYDKFMKDNLFSGINIKPENTHIPNGETDTPEAECEAYEKAIKENGGIDLQILGIGHNGHIGFNEPDVNLNSFTHITNLTENTIKANSRFFASSDEVPKQAITMGIASILKARKILLLASGANKSRVVGELLNDGINTSVPATLLKTHPDVVLICDEEAYSGSKLGIDIGGTNIKFAVVEGKNLLFKCKIKTPEKLDDIINAICDKVVELKKEYNIKSAGIGTPGIIKKGLVTADNLPFKGFPLEKTVEEKTGLYVSVDNDANCAALGELIFGNTKDCEHIILVTLGTGIGGGIIMNRQICHSNNNMGEIGHFIIQSEKGRECTCGQRGCWEQYCSATALLKDAKKAAEKDPESLLYKCMLENGKMDGETFFKALDGGCKAAEKVYKYYIKYLARGIESLVNIFGPDAVVLAGGVTQQGDKLLKPLHDELKKDIRIEISSLQSDAGALGAAML